MLLTCRYIRVLQQLLAEPGHRPAAQGAAMWLYIFSVMQHDHCRKTYLRPERCEMFNMSMGVGEHVVRGVAVYVFLFLLLRFVGKKHVGELAPFDLLVLLILSETVQNSLVGDDTSLIGGLISASTLVLCAYGISFLTNHNKLAERILEGTPKILIRHGRRRPSEMAKQGISSAELTEALRHQGFANITNIRAAILENDGRISVLGD
jgi:uncharacterized membrane protein YcaP (DUF421 family)